VSIEFISGLGVCLQLFVFHRVSSCVMASGVRCLHISLTDAASSISFQVKLTVG
jgi:hypothetical protein